MQQRKPMRRFGALRATRLFHFVVACLVAWLSVPPDAAIAAEPLVESDTLEWLDDYKQALALAQQTGRPLLVEFRCAP